MKVYFYKATLQDGTELYVPFCDGMPGRSPGVYYSQSRRSSSIMSTHRNGDNDCWHTDVRWEPPLVPGLKTINLGSGWRWESPGGHYYEYSFTLTGYTVFEYWPQYWGVYQRFAAYTLCSTNNGSLLQFNRETTEIGYGGDYRHYTDQWISSNEPFGLSQALSFVRDDSSLPSPTQTEIDFMINRGIDMLLAKVNELPPRSEAFRLAVNSIGDNTNNIANAIEMVSFVKDLMSFDIVDIIKDVKDIAKSPKRLANALSSGWLGYRYSYSTTKSDLQELTNYLLSYVDPESITDLKRYETVSNDAGRIVCKVVFSSGDPINKTLRHLKTTGLMLDAYNAWDMVPLSFVVDWFLPIGDFLEDLSSNWVAQPSVFNFSEIEYSTKVLLRDETEGLFGKYYRRWIDKNPPPFETYSPDPSGKTVKKRIFDGIALIIP